MLAAHPSYSKYLELADIFSKYNSTASARDGSPFRRLKAPIVGNSLLVVHVRCHKTINAPFPGAWMSHELSGVAKDGGERREQ